MKIPESELINPEVSNQAVKFSKYADVRNYVLKIEHEVAKENNIVIEGRDIGSAVFPNAILKIFLTASIETRSNRRYEEFKRKGLLGNRTQADIQNEIALRDKEDKERKIAPLMEPKDAVRLESDNLSCEELVEKIKHELSKKLSK